MRGWVPTLLVLTACLVSGGMAVTPVAGGTKQAAEPVQAAGARPVHTLAEFEKTGKMGEDDPFSQVRPFIGELINGTLFLETGARTSLSPAEHREHREKQAHVSRHLLAQTQVGKVRSFCEICILVMQMKERGQPHLCAGLNANYYTTCIEVLESLLRSDKAVVYWLKNGCMHMDPAGPEIVRPCPALNICSWTPNLFAEPPSLTKDGVEALCPKDNKFLPTIPNEYKDLLTAAAAPAG